MENSNSDNKSYNFGFEIGGTNIKVSYLSTEHKMPQIIDDSNKTNSLLTTSTFHTTDDPIQTISTITTWITTTQKIQASQINKIGICMFGPLDLKTGKVLNTPKKGWKQFPIVSTLSEQLKIQPSQITIEVDVNCCANLEYKSGGYTDNNNNKINSLAYITIGTGVGVGVIAEGNLIHGLQHPEGGHIRVKKLQNDNFEGVCSLHKDCVEGLVSNVAIKNRKGLDSVHEVKNVSENDDVWDTVGYYLAQQCIAILYLLSSQKIIIGGGLINNNGFLNAIRKHFVVLNGGYIDNAILKEDTVSEYIVRSAFKNDTGVLAALNLVVD